MADSDGIGGIYTAPHPSVGGSGYTGIGTDKPITLLTVNGSQAGKRSVASKAYTVLDNDYIISVTEEDTLITISQETLSKCAEYSRILIIKNETALACATIVGTVDGEGGYKLSAGKTMLRGVEPFKQLVKIYTAYAFVVLYLTELGAFVISERPDLEAIYKEIDDLKMTCGGGDGGDGGGGK